MTTPGSDADAWRADDAGGALIRKGSVVHALALSAHRFKEKEARAKQRLPLIGTRGSRRTCQKLGIGTRFIVGHLSVGGQRSTRCIATVGWMRKDRRYQAASGNGAAGDEPLDVARALAASPSLLRLQQRAAAGSKYVDAVFSNNQWPR